MPYLMIRLISMLEKAEAGGEQQRDVVAGVVVADAGAGKVADVAFDEEGGAIFQEEIGAERRAGGEVDVGGGAGRNFVAGEDDAAFGCEVGARFFCRA